MLSKTGEIRRDDVCVDNNGGSVILYNCHGSKGNQEWLLEDWGGIKNPSSGKCLALTEAKVIVDFSFMQERSSLLQRVTIKTI